MKKKSGITLIELLMGTLVSGIILLASISFLKSLFFKQKKEEQISNIHLLREKFWSSFNCDATVNPRPQGCNNGDWIEINSNETPSTLIQIPNQKQYTQIYDLLLRAKCVDCLQCSFGKKILVEVTTDISLKNPNWKDLFDGVPIGCVVPSQN